MLACVTQDCHQFILILMSKATQTPYLSHLKAPSVLVTALTSNTPPALDVEKPF